MVISERPKMNQRFSELKKQAHDYAVDEEWYIDSFEQRFAELIVRECIAICQHNSDDDDDQFDLGRVYQAKEITQLIKTHFGVEE